MDLYTVIIIATGIGFFALAAALLVPVWRFLNSEEDRAEEWTPERLRERGIAGPPASDNPETDLQTGAVDPGTDGSESRDDQRS